MKIVDVQEKHQPFDVASGLAESLIAQGTHKQFIKLDPAPLPNTRWSVREGDRVEDYIHPPQIWYSCSSCGNKGFMEGPNCHRTQKFFHCLVQEQVPPAVQQQYADLRKAWEKRFRRKPSE